MPASGTEAAYPGVFSHTNRGAVITADGNGFTVTELDVFEQPVTASLYVNVITPGATPVTTPASVIVAIRSLLLSHEPTPIPPIGSYPHCPRP